MVLRGFRAQTNVSKIEAKQFVNPLPGEMEVAGSVLKFEGINNITMREVNSWLESECAAF